MVTTTLRKRHSGQPPFEWISQNEILYKNMIPIDWNQSKCVLKCANIKDKTITEWLTKTETLTTGGGKINYDWFTNQVLYNEFPMDIKNKALLPKDSTYIVKQNLQKTEIRFNDKLLLNHDGYLYVDTCISSSKQNFAYFVRFDGNIDSKSTFALYMKTNDTKEPVVIYEIQFYTYPIAWIENTGKEN